MQELNLHDFGDVIQVGFTKPDGSVRDVSAATRLVMHLTRPDLFTMQGTGTFVNTGADGLVSYTIQSGDLSLAGIWLYQGEAYLGSKYFHSPTSQFRVNADLL